MWLLLMNYFVRKTRSNCKLLYRTLFSGSLTMCDLLLAKILLSNI